MPDPRLTEQERTRICQEYETAESLGAFDGALDAAFAAGVRSLRSSREAGNERGMTFISPEQAAVLATVKAVMPDLAACHRAIERLGSPAGTCPPDCRGIEIEPGRWSGCRCSSATGEARACDCPQHRRLGAPAATGESAGGLAALVAKYEKRTEEDGWTGSVLTDLFYELKALAAGGTPSSATGDCVCDFDEGIEGEAPCACCGAEKGERCRHSRRAPPPPTGADPDARVKKGFRIGIEAAARAVETQMVSHGADAAEIVRALAPSSDPALAEWFEADGSVRMLPAEEVTRRRKLAAKVIAAADVFLASPDSSQDRGGHSADGPSRCPGCVLRREIAAIDAVPSSATRPAPPPTASSPSGPGPLLDLGDEGDAPAHLDVCSPAGCAPGCPYRGEDAGAIGEGSIA